MHLDRKHVGMKWVFHTSCNSATQEVSTGLKFNTLFPNWLSPEETYPPHSNTTLEKLASTKIHGFFQSLSWHSLGIKGKNHTVISDFPTEAESWHRCYPNRPDQRWGRTPNLLCSPRKCISFLRKPSCRREGDACTRLAWLWGHDVAGADMQL